MARIITLTVTQDSACNVANFINANATHVDGRAVFTRWGKPAASWGTGSVSVKVRARTTRGSTDVWFKVGSTVTVTV